jgi:hypothetical protein
VPKKEGVFGTLRWQRPTAESLEGLQAGLVAQLGIPRAPAPHDATPLSEARYLLRAASEVEHGLLVQYLYAAFSINPTASGPVLVNGWPRRYTQIAIQEMFHLISVQNLSLALGGEPYYDRADFPVATGQGALYPFPFALEPLSLESVAKYGMAESPIVVPSELQAEIAQIAQKANQAAGGTVNHVGALYAMLYWLFQPTDTPEGPWQLNPAEFPAGWHLKPEDFVSEPVLEARLATNAEFEGEGMPSDPRDPTFTRIVWEVKNAVDAMNAITQIAVQGEGWDTADEMLTHFEEFLSLYRGLTQFLAQTGQSPVHQVPTHPNTTPSGTSDPRLDEGRITHPDSLRWASLFNARYEIMLAELYLALAQPRPSDPGAVGRDALIAQAINGEMRGSMGVRGLARKLVTLPRRGVVPGGIETAERAAAPFEIPGVLPEGLAEQWKHFRALLQNATQLVDAILALQAGPGKPTEVEKTRLVSLKAADAALLAAIPTV